MAFIVKLDDNPEGIWVDYKNGARVKIRPLSKTQARELRRSASSTETEWVRGRLIEKESVDEGQYDRLLADHLIEDWQGFVDPQNAEIPCNPKTKHLMMDRLLEFANFVIDSAMNIQGHLVRREADLTENLSSTSAG